MAVNQIGKRVFISYRGKDFLAAQEVKNHLVRSGHDVILFPPQLLSVEGEILLPFEFIELMEFILDDLHKCQTLVAIDQGDFWESYWTQMEVTQWQRFKDRPEAFAVRVEGSGVIYMLGELNLTTLSNEEKKLWAKISVGTNRSMQASSRMPTFWGRYARSCFLVPCSVCGEHFLASQKAVYASIKDEFQVRCPHCHTGPLQFHEEPQRGTFYRKPVLISSLGQRKPRILDASEIVALLALDELPPTVKIISLPGESFRSDATKALLGTGVAVIAGAALLGLSYFFSSSGNRNDS